MHRIRTSAAAAAAIAAGLVAIGLPIGGSAAAQTAPHVTVSPGSAAPGAAITITGALSCPDMEPGGGVVVWLEQVTDDDIVGTTFPVQPPLRGDDTFELVTTVPTEMVSRIFHTSTPTPVGEYTVGAHCSVSEGNDDPAYGTFTVTAAPPPTTTTSTTSTTTTTTSTTTSTTVAPPTTTEAPTTSVPAPTTTVTGQVFVPPATPPAGAVPFANPTSGAVAPGSELSIDEDGFVPGEQVQVVLYSTPRVLGARAADETGAVRFSIAIPDDVPPGEHTLVLYGADAVKSTALTIIDPTPGTPPPGATAPDGDDGATSAGGDELARTGSGTTLLTLLGLGLTVLGAAVLRTRRSVLEGR